MNIKMKAVVAAVALGVSSMANSAIITGLNETNGELFMTVLDPTAQKSYGLDLGITAGALKSDPSQSLSFNLALDANYADFVGKTNLVYVIAGVDSDFTDPALWGYLTTSTQNVGGPALYPNVQNFATIAARMSIVGSWTQDLNSAAGDTTNNAANNSHVSLIGQTGYADVPTWGNNLGGSGFTATQTVGSSVAFWNISLDQTDFDTGVATQLNNVWTLGTNGALTFAAPTAVPVPAAFWLFGSGLLGMVGVSRRRSAN
jgi:hypothetical protein